MPGWTISSYACWSLARISGEDSGCFFIARSPYTRRLDLSIDHGVLTLCGKLIVMGSSSQLALGGRESRTSGVRRSVVSQFATRCPRPHCGGTMVQDGAGVRCLSCGRGETLDYDQQGLFRDFCRR